MRILLVSIVSVVIFCVMTCSGAVSDPFRLAVGFFLYFSIRFFLFDLKDRIILYLPNLLSVFYVFYAYFFADSGIRFWENLPLDIIIPILLFMPFRANWKKLKVFTVAITTSIFLYFFWFEYVSIITDDRSVKEFPEDIEFLKRNDTISKDALFENKTAILVFFSKGCSICFKEMPNYEKFSREHLDKNVELSLVYLPFNEFLDETDEEILFEVSEKYRLSILNTKLSFKSVTNLLGFKGVPHCIVVKNGKITYSGRFNYEPYYIFNHIHRITRKD